MALNISIKNVPDALAEKLRLRAEANHRSLQGELMALIESSVRNHELAEGIDQLRSAQTNNPLLVTQGAATSPALTRHMTLREVGERMRSRFPAPMATPKGMSAVELVRQMRDGRDGNQSRDPGHHDKGD